MKRAGSANVCPRCGQTGSAMLEDGTDAEFETGAPARAPLGLIAGVFLLAAAGLGAAGWGWRAELGALFSSEAPVAATVTEDAPGWRLARRDEFAEPLTSGLIGVFGTSGEDTPAAFAALGSGELVTLLSGPVGTPGPVFLVRLDGSADLGVIPLAAPGGLVGASLAPGEADGFYLALTEPSGVRLLAFQDGIAPVWSRDLARGLAPERQAKVIAAGGQVYLAGPAESAGRLSVAAYAPAGGALLWQRSFEAPEDGRLFASPLESGGLFLAYETAVAETGAEASALWLSPAGETTGALAGLGIDGRLAGALPAAGQAVLLAEGALVRLEGFDAGGQRAWSAPVAEATLQETLTLAPLTDGGVAVVSAYRLSDVQTDVTVSRFSAGGALLGAARHRLPPGVRAGGLAATGRSGFILSGRVGEGAAADAFLLALDWAGETGEAAPGLAEGAGKAKAVPAKAAPPAPRPDPEPISEPVPQPEPEPAPKTDPNPGPEMLACRFTCQDGETVFPLSRTLEAAGARGAAALEAVSAEACRMLGAEPAAGAAPVCAP